MEYPFLLGVYDAEISKTLSPQLVRQVLLAVKETKQKGGTEKIKALSLRYAPKDPKIVSRLVLPSIAKQLVRNQKSNRWVGQNEQDRVESLLKTWRSEVLHL